MQPTMNKRGWLYGGLAMPAGAAMVRRAPAPVSAQRATPPQVLLVGDKTASAMEPTLKKVLSDHGRALGRVPLNALAQAVKPGSLVVVTDLPVEVVVAAATALHKVGVRLVVVPAASPWIVTPRARAVFAKCRTSLVPVQRLAVATTADGVPTTAGYAVLAGAVWTYLR